MKVWREWLPDSIAQEASREEPQRFSLIVSGLSQEWSRTKDPAATLKWVSLFNRYSRSRGVTSLVSAVWCRACVQAVHCVLHVLSLSSFCHAFVHGWVVSQLCSREGRIQIRRSGQSCNHCAGHPAILPAALCSSGTVQAWHVVMLRSTLQLYVLYAGTVGLQPSTGAQNMAT